MIDKLVNRMIETTIILMALTSIFFMIFGCVVLVFMAL